VRGNGTRPFPGPLTQVLNGVARRLASVTVPKVPHCTDALGNAAAMLALVSAGPTRGRASRDLDRLKAAGDRDVAGDDQRALIEPSFHCPLDHDLRGALVDGERGPRSGRRLSRTR
jgi:hypothetical protein